MLQFLKTIQTAISIGQVVPAGKEGPIVQIGAAIGSGFGQFLNLSSDRLRILQVVELLQGFLLSLMLL